jgi:diacylglycerol O-acyltransferase
VIDRQRLIITFVTNLRGPDAPLALVHARVGEVARVTTTVGNVPVVFAALCYAGTLRLTDPDPDACRSWTNALVADLRAEVDALCASAPTGADRRLASQAGLRGWHIR